MGDDSCLILWDARTGSSPAVKVILLFFSFLHNEGFSLLYNLEVEMCYIMGHAFEKTRNLKFAYYE